MSNTAKTIMRLNTITTVVCGLVAVIVVVIACDRVYTGLTSYPKEAPQELEVVQDTGKNYKTLDVFYAKSAITLQTVVHCPTGKTFTVSNRGGMIDLGVKTECSTGP